MARRRMNGPAGAAIALAILSLVEGPAGYARAQAKAGASKPSPEALFELARTRFAEDDYRRSRAACAVLRKAHPKHILYEVCMARAFLVWRRASRADGHIQAALRADPNHLEALFALAEAQRMRGEDQSAQTTYKRVLALDPRYAEANIGLATLHRVHDRKEAAESTLRDGLAKHPGNPEMSYLLGTIAQPPEAIGLLERALASRPGWNDAEAALGAALVANKQYDKAELRLRSVLKRDPKNGIAQGKLGEVLLAQGQLQPAETTLLKALEVQPNHPDAALALARLYGQTDRDEDAFEYFRKAAGMRATDSEPLVEAAELARKHGRTVLAAAFVERALERHPNQARALCLRGDLQAERGDRAGAIESYRRALASHAPADPSIDRGVVEQKLRALE